MHAILTATASLSPPAEAFDPPIEVWSRLDKLLHDRLRKCVALLSRVLSKDDPDAVHDLRVWSRRSQQRQQSMALYKLRAEASHARKKTYKIIEVIGVSDESVHHAIRNALLKARKTLRNLDWFEVGQIRGAVRNGQPEFQVEVRIDFRLESGGAD